MALSTATTSRSWRDSGAALGATTGTGAEIRQKIGTLDGSWVIGPRSHATFKYTHFENPTQGRPDNTSSALINTTPGTQLDVNNQFAEGAYLGMLLLEKALTAASTGPGGLTRANVVAVLNSTSGWTNGLTVSPLSWSGNSHFAETSVHAIDELYPSGFGGWQYIQGSQTQDSNPGQI